MKKHESTIDLFELLGKVIQMTYPEIDIQVTGIASEKIFKSEQGCSFVELYTKKNNGNIIKWKVHEVSHITRNVRILPPHEELVYKISND